MGRVRTNTFTLSVSDAMGVSSSAAGMMSCRGGRRRPDVGDGDDEYAGDASWGLRRMGTGLCRGCLHRTAQLHFMFADVMTPEGQAAW